MVIFCQEFPLASYWIFKGLTVLAILAGADYIRYRDLHGKDLSSSLILLVPYIVALVLPKKWISWALAIPISAAAIITLPVLVSFAWGFHTDPRQDFKLLLVLLAVVALAIASILAAILNRKIIQGRVLALSLGTSLLYYLAAAQYAR